MGNQQGLSQHHYSKLKRQNKNYLQSPNPEITVNTLYVSFKMFSDVYIHKHSHTSIKKLSIYTVLKLMFLLLISETSFSWGETPFSVS